ncbi:hypothetical protein ACFV0Z_04025 [Streptomyces xiamenensis]|uniref:hypothetical protein n=1 Tax=Streptomyces xiamenensis TaxID=408015 RepID=UPI0036C3B5DF
MAESESELEMKDREETPLERRLRELLTERADRVVPSEAPLEMIARKGRAARQRGRMALGAGLAVLVAVPGFALAAQGGGSDGAGASTSVPPAAPPAPDNPPPASETSQEPGEQLSGSQEGDPLPPSDPERQLLDGISLEQATETLRVCLTDDLGRGSLPEEFEMEEPAIESLRIMLAWQGEGDENRGLGAKRQVLAVTDDPAAERRHQLVCATESDGSFANTQRSGHDALATGQVVSLDPNAGRYYASGEWAPPFRWANFGLVSPEVAQVTMTYAGATQEAVLEAGYFVVAGIAEQAPAGDPVIQGYDESGELIYDSQNEGVFP